MKIGFDSHALRPPFTGIGNYSWNLIKGLREIDATSDFTFFSYYLRGQDIRVPEHPRNKIQVRRKLPWMLMQKAWMALGIPSTERWFGDFDIVHGLFNFAPPSRRSKRVITVYDVAFLKYPERFTPAHARHFDRSTGYSVRSCDAVIAISENTKRDIVDCYGISPSKVTATPLGIDLETFHPILDAQALEAGRKRFGLKGKVILYIGTLEPRKNLGVLLDAFDTLNAKYKGEFQLVLAGKQGHGMEALMPRLEKLVSAGLALVPGYVSQADAVLLYSLAEVFAYPSVYEGFGFPPLEAMASGCPVVTSNTSSLPEVVGTAGLTVDPLDPTALAEALLRIATEPELRQKLVMDGLSRAKEFTWARTARMTWELYQSLSSR